jgi:hypothetical protein
MASVRKNASRLVPRRCRASCHRHGRPIETVVEIVEEAASLGPARRSSIFAVMATQICQAATANRETEMNRQLSDFLQTAHLEPLNIPINIPSRDLSDEVRSDSARIIPSPPFPRLQAEAQILMHEIDSGVRTQLTHWMKVAMSGRVLAGNAFKSLCQRAMIEKELQATFLSTVENACLLHDLGNPRLVTSVSPRSLHQRGLSKWEVCDALAS